MRCQMPQTQAQTLAARLPPPKPKKGDEAKVIIPSALELTQEQESRMLQHFAQRFKDLSTELGRANYESPAYNAIPITTLQRNYAAHFGKRHLAHLIYQQRMEWRQWVLGGIWAETNIHLPLTTRITGQQIARANKTFFGSSPFFAVNGLSSDSDPLARDLDSMAHHFLDTIGGISAGLEDAIALAFIQGECAVKTKHHKLTSYFQSYREVALDPKGNPYVAQDGDYIYRTDLFVPALVPVMDEATGQIVQDPETGAPMMQEGTDMVLKRDMATPMPATLDWQMVKLDLTKVLADRVESKPIYYLDFLCPLNAPDVQQADVVIQCYNSKVIELAAQYLRDEWGASPTDQLERVSRMVNELTGGTPDAKQAIGDRDRPEQGEYSMNNNTGRDRNEPLVGLAECWGWYDVFGDGVPRNIMVLMDQDGNIPIYYDYVENLCDDGLRPIDIVRINPVTGRWHGQGNVERFYNLQDQADLLINRALFAESRAARVDFWDPSKTIEGELNPNLELNWGGTYRLANGARVEDVLKPVYLENIKSANLKDLLQLVMQTMQAMSAVSNVNDGAMSGLDTAKLATGIRNLEASGEELYHQYISQLRPCIESILRRALRTLVKTLLSTEGNKQKVIKFFDKPSKRFVELDINRLSDLDLDVELTLTTYDRQSRLQSTQLAFNMLAAYLQSVGAPPQILEQRLGPLVANNLRALQVRNPDDLTAPIPEEMRMLAAPGMPATGAGADQVEVPSPV